MRPKKLFGDYTKTKVFDQNKDLTRKTRLYRKERTGVGIPNCIVLICRQTH